MAFFSNKIGFLPVLIISSAFFFGCSKSPYEETLKTSLCVPDQPSGALIHIALQEKLFSKYGLEVEESHYPSGKRAMTEGFLKNRCEFTALTDAPFTANLKNSPNMEVFATTFSANNLNRIVVRTDKGINELKDLAGKTIGTQQNSAVHFFLHSVLLTQENLKDQVHIKFYKAEELVAALENGEIDAFSMREPYVSNALAAMPDKTKALAFPGVYYQYELLASNLLNSPQGQEKAQRLLLGVLDALEMVRLEPAKAIQITAQALGITPEQIRPTFKVENFNVMLEQSLLLLFKYEHEWYVSEGVLPKQTINFSAHINSDVLKSIRPEAVLLRGEN